MSTCSNKWKLLAAEFRNFKIRQYEEATITLSTGCASDQTFIGKGQSLADG